MRSAPLVRLLAAALASGMALSSAFGLASVLSRQAAAKSHALPEARRNYVDLRQASPALIQHGGTLFLNSCAHCHGADARGDEGPDLHDLQVSDRRIAAVINGGIKGEMPAFARKHGPEEVRALIAYLRTLP